MGSEWSEDQAGPQGPPGPAGSPGGLYLMSSVGTSNTICYFGTSEAVVTGAQVSGSLLGGFRYRLSAHVPVRSSAAGDVAELRWRRGAALGDAVIAIKRVHLPAANVDFYADFAGMYDHDLADGSQTFTLSCLRYSGSGTVQVRPAPWEPAYIELQEARVSGFGSF